MRTWAVAALVALAACGGGGGKPAATAPPTTVPATTKPPSPTDSRPSLDVVMSALKATRAKSTASFEIEATTSFGGLGHVSMIREGAYDVRNGRTKVTQSFEAEPKELAESLFGDEVEVDDLVAHSLGIGGVGYVQMPAWPASIRSKWLKFSKADIARLSGSTGVALDVPVFPPVIEMLSSAEATNVPTFGNTHYVSVPASLAILSTPGSSAVRALKNAGVDVEDVPGNIQVAVDVEGGLVTAVKFDTIDAFRAAWTKAGATAAAQAISSVETIVTLADHGVTVTIAAPPASAVMTEREFENAT